MNEIFILGGARTPMAEYTGKLKDFSAIELGAIAARAAMERTGVKPQDIDHVVCCWAFLSSDLIGGGPDGAAASFAPRW